ncbi:MAG: radical SAM family heme chaperone HemW [Acidimicrobiales bacterium]
MRTAAGASPSAPAGASPSGAAPGTEADVPFGVYVHVPFCASRCDYCAFATWTDRHHLMEDYVRACVVEVDRAVAGGMPEATSVFFGGGTPSLLPARSLLTILAAIPRRLDAEVTVECNPETVGGALVDDYRAGGVTRLSFGVQSLVPRVLTGLGRSHAADDVPRAVAVAGRAGFERMNVDLIYGGPGESDSDWAATLAGILALDPRPTHVSAYALTVEPGTPLAADPGRHPDDDVQAARYEVADEVLSAAGLAWYELSNWAVPGHECRHNQLYWAQGDYRGIGCSAHSHRDGRRWWNVRTPERYVAAVVGDRPPVAAEEQLAPGERVLEGLQLALRTRDGVPRWALPAGPGGGADPDLEGLVEPAGLAGDRLVLTRRGRLLANEVAVRLRC